MTTNRPFALLIAMLATAALAACSLTLPERIELAATGVVAARQAGTAAFDARCSSVGRTCVEPKLTDCAAWVQCNRERDAMYATAAALRAALRSALSLAQVDEPTAAGILASVLPQLGQLWALVQSVVSAATGGSVALPASLPTGGR